MDIYGLICICLIWSFAIGAFIAQKATKNNKIPEKVQEQDTEISCGEAFKNLKLSNEFKQD